MADDLIFDLGLHKGEDSEYYLKKGFRVVGVDANAELCAEVAARFAAEIASGQFVIVNKAIAREPGVLKFYRNVTVSVWGTLNADWAERNRRKGAESVECEVEATTVAALIEEHGAPYYLKVDIEGNDLLAVEGLAGAAIRPKYVSLESDKDSFRGLRREIEVLTSLGYDGFKIVDQLAVTEQRQPSPAREGREAAHVFQKGSTGLFGAELDGDWISAEAVIEAYRRIFLNYALTGDDPFVKSLLLRKVLRRLGFKASWHDTHARLASGSAFAQPT